MSKKKSVTKKDATLGAAAIAAAAGTGAFFASQDVESNDMVHETPVTEDVIEIPSEETIESVTKAPNLAVKKVVKQDISIETLKSQLSIFINNIQSI